MALSPREQAVVWARRRQAEANRRGVRIPAVKTLARYGLTLDDWLTLLEDQGWVCPVCMKPALHWNTDHEHVPGWKLMPPEQRRRYVRGVLCVRCNYRLVHSTANAATVSRVAHYLWQYEQRRDA